jgi:hypothetical protein
MKHITGEDLYAFHHDTMNQKEREAFLEHVSSCSYCSNQFAASMSECLIKAPLDLKANILKATKLPEVQIAAKVKETSKRMQLFLYSLKVGTATVCALLLLLFTMNYSKIPIKLNLPEITAVQMTTETKDNISLSSKMRDKIDTIGNNMLDFTNDIFHGGN